MSTIDLPPQGDIAFFQDLEPKTQIVFTLTECPSQLHAGKYIYWISKEGKIVEKGCWDAGKEQSTIVTTAIDKDTNEPAPDLKQVKVPDLIRT